MNKEIYEKNLEIIKEKYKDIHDKIYDECVIYDEIIDIEEDLQGEIVLSIIKSGKQYYLNSKYSQKDAVEKWLIQFENVNSFNIIIIFGLSNFNHIKELVKIMPDDTPILLYEPCIGIFTTAIQYIDIAEVLMRKATILCVKGLNDKYLKQFIQCGIEYATLNTMVYCCMPNYDVLFEKDWENILMQVKQKCEGVILTRNTIMAFSSEFIENMLSNCEDMIGEYAINQLYDAFRNIKDIEKVPAIIVSAGPSLDKNIDDLKLAVGKSIIIAVDTAIKSLLNHNIVPNLVVTIDPHKPPVLFMHKKFKDIPMVMCEQSNRELCNIHNGKRFYFSSPNSYLSSLYMKIKGETVMMTETGGSVANNAFSLAQILGVKKFILVGQDLAYPNNKFHADDAYGGEAYQKIELGNRYCLVEDIYGCNVVTERNMNQYREWFEDKITYEKLDVIDATEGGAKIHGSKIMTLKDAIQEYCVFEMEVDTIIDAIKPVFTDDEQRVLKKEIDEMPERLDEAMKKIESGVRDYERMQYLYKRGKTRGKEFERILDKVEEINVYVETEPIFELVSLYNRDVEYDVLGKVYSVYEDENKEINYICEKGIQLLKSYENGIKELKKDIQNNRNIQEKDIESIKEKLNESINVIQELYENNEINQCNSMMKELYTQIVKYINMVIILQNKEPLKKRELQGLIEQIIIYQEKNAYDEIVKVIRSELA